MRIALALGACLTVLALETSPAAACSFDSDCAYGKCRSGKCGACSFDSDCKGHGKCRSGWCQGCSFDSDCKVGRCRNGKCGGCSFDSDCNGYGKCRNGRCQGCSFDSDCKYGKCRSGKCGACSFDSDCKGHGKCRSGWCTQSTWRPRAGGCLPRAGRSKAPWLCAVERRGAGGGPLWGDLVVSACGTEPPSAPRFGGAGRP